MRKINPRMARWLDLKLKYHGAAQQALKRNDPRSFLVYASEVCDGIREQGGNNKGPMVELIQDTIGRSQGEAWCLSFVQTLIAYVELKFNIVSPIFPTEHCMTCWRNTNIKQRVLRVPAPGAIPIWNFIDTDKGHTGIMTEWGAGFDFECVEGNTEKGLAGDKIVREGGGVYLTRRAKKPKGNMKLMGFLKPF